MRKITNTEEVNIYFNIINKSISDYIKNYFIKPHELKRYFTDKKRKSFLEKNNIADVQGINRVFNDVIDHLVDMENDRIMTFESFNKDIADIYEKLLCDIYKVSLSNVAKSSSKENIYTIDDFGDKVVCLLKSKDEMIRLRDSISEALMEETMKRSLSVSSVSHCEIGPIKIPLSNIVDQKKMKEELQPLLTELQVKKWLTDNILKKYNYTLKYKGLFSEIHVWEMIKNNN